jgi:metal-responsive CopG/Arc/MetJ family transcriptional regulator
MTTREKGHRTTKVLTISLPISLAEEVERYRRYDSRSAFVLRALDRYLIELERDGNKIRYQTKTEEEQSAAAAVTVDSPKNGLTSLE